MLFHAWYEDTQTVLMMIFFLVPNKNFRVDKDSCYLSEGKFVCSLG